MAVERKAVTSSNIASVGFCEKCQHVYVEFKNGTLYKVPATAEEHQALIKAPSIGSHYHKVFRSRTATKLNA
ncbi:MAG TPA: KTSC domain-containing protein [Blastocatellia bacterium]|nr:KTSC domain-containing protein [Blastocatellia bacterium]